ncbi:MAG: ABC transporter ATP-binding protein [Candidatus Micrarchaeaceae archaeon]|jgi:zinc/manganese transport system ATP-binding protein
MVMREDIVEVKNLTIGYKDKIVWKDASFSVKRGEFVAVIGPNGAGKTTMFRLLLGLQQQIKGTIKVFDDRPRRGNSKIGYIPQRHTIDNDTNIECIELVRLAYSGNKWGFSLSSQEEKKLAYDTLAAVGATELANKSLGSLSGGELQRIFLAEALVSNPEMLLLDEPLSNLDIKRIKDLVSLMNTVVKSRNVTAFLVAHDINPLIQFLDKVIYIANGKVATGTPEEVLTSKRLTALYGTRVEVLHDSKGNIVVVGAEDYHGDQ